MTFFDGVVLLLAMASTIGIGYYMADEGWRRLPSLPTWLRFVVITLACCLVSVLALALVAAGQPSDAPPGATPTPDVVDFWTKGLGILFTRVLNFFGAHPWAMAAAFAFWFARAMTIGALKERWSTKEMRPGWASMILGALDPTVRFTRWLFRAFHVPRAWTPPDGAPPDDDDEPREREG